MLVNSYGKNVYPNTPVMKTYTLKSPKIETGFFNRRQTRIHHPAMAIVLLCKRNPAGNLYNLSNEFFEELIRLSKIKEIVDWIGKDIKGFVKRTGQVLERIKSFQNKNANHLA